MYLITFVFCFPARLHPSLSVYFRIFPEVVHSLTHYFACFFNRIKIKEWNSVESSAQDSETAESESNTRGRPSTGGGAKRVGGKGGKPSNQSGGGGGGGHPRQRGEISSNIVHVQFEGEQVRHYDGNKEVLLYTAVYRCAALHHEKIDVVHVQHEGP